MALSSVVSHYCLTIMNAVENVHLAVAFSILACKDHSSIECQYVKDPWNGIIVQSGCMKVGK